MRGKKRRREREVLAGEWLSTTSNYQWHCSDSSRHWGGARQWMPIFIPSPEWYFQELTTSISICVQRKNSDEMNAKSTGITSHFILAGISLPPLLARFLLPEPSPCNLATLSY